MAEGNLTQVVPVRSMKDVLREIEFRVKASRASAGQSDHSIKDLRWKFDQVSAIMNQAIYNDQTGKVHESCLETVGVLIEILVRT